MNRKVKNRFFLVGCVRSGTTLLQSLLAAHPQIASFPESHFIPQITGIERRWRRFSGVSPNKARKILYKFLEDIGGEGLGNLIPKYGFLIRHYTDAFVKILDTMTVNEHKEIWVEKTPCHLHFISTIERFIPDIKFIHIIRRGEDVVASMYEVTHKHPEVWGGIRSIETCVKRWNEDVKITRQHIHKENHTLLSYEQLVDKSENVLRNLCKFIGVKYSQLMIKQHGLAAEKIILENQEWVESAKGEIRSANGKKFAALFNEREQEFIIKHLEKLI